MRWRLKNQDTTGTVGGQHVGTGKRWSKGEAPDECRPNSLKLWIGVGNSAGVYKPTYRIDIAITTSSFSRTVNCIPRLRSDNNHILWDGVGETLQIKWNHWIFMHTNVVDCCNNSFLTKFILMTRINETESLCGGLVQMLLTKTGTTIDNNENKLINTSIKLNHNKTITQKRNKKPWVIIMKRRGRIMIANHIKSFSLHIY